MVQNKETKGSVAELIKPYSGKWVALSVDQQKVLSVANTAQAVLAEAKKKGESFPHLVRAPGRIL